MDETIFTQWFAFVALACWGILGMSRAFVFHRQGRSVIVVDRQRTVGQMVIDLVAMVCLLGWAYEVVAHAWQFRFHIGPAGFHEPLFQSFTINITGAVAMSGGLTVYALALQHLGESWRMGIDRNNPGPLITTGVYSWSRHPIYVAFDLVFAGTFLLRGSWFFLLLALIWFAVIHAIMLREERFLSRLHGDTYREYCSRVGRYFTWCG